MEDVLEVYHRPEDPDQPTVCMDEASRQLVSETRLPLPAKPGMARRVDYEYRREGTANIFMLFEPLKGKRVVKVTRRRTRGDWAWLIRDLVDVHYPRARKITLVMDNLNTHSGASLYEAFEPAEARRIFDRLEIHYTPKHGSWLNMAEIELNALSLQCLRRRIPDMETLKNEIGAWQTTRNSGAKPVNWRFTTADARIKLKSLYPVLETHTASDVKTAVAEH